MRVIQNISGWIERITIRLYFRDITLSALPSPVGLTEVTTDTTYTTDRN